MFRETLTSINNWFRLIQKGILVLAVFITVFKLFSFFMIEDKNKINFNMLERNQKKFYTFINNPEFQKSKSGQLQVAYYKMFLCATIGETCTDNPADANNNYQHSFMGKISNLVLAPYAQPPASGLAWTYSGLSQAGFVPQAQAQGYGGIGFYAIQPLSLIWKVFRNITYMLLVLVILSIGFLIMFRSNVGAQTVISIENALPRIVIALLLITFSFAIAGFMIDIMYVLMGLGGNIIIENIAGSPDKIAAVSKSLGWVQDSFNQPGFGLFNAVVSNSNIWQTGSALLSFVPFGLQLVLRTLISGILMAYLTYFEPKTSPFLQGKVLEGILFAGPLSPLVVGIVAAVLGAIIALFMPLIISLFVYSTALVLFFRLFFLLLMTYTKILLSIIFAPIILFFEAIPGTSTFGYWFKGLFFNLLTFPIVAILIMTSGLIANIGDQSFWTAAGTVAPAQNLWQAPFIQSVNAEGFVMIVALSILFLIPDFVAYIKKMFGVEDLPFSMTPGKFFSGAPVALNTGLNLMMRARTLSRELGWYRDKNATGFGKVLNVIRSENPNEAIANIVNRQAEQTGATS